MKISTNREYYNNGDFCIFVCKYTNKYCYQDSFGYKSYKTLSGLEKMLKKNGLISEDETIEEE